MMNRQKQSGVVLLVTLLIAGIMSVLLAFGIQQYMTDSRAIMGAQQDAVTYHRLRGALLEQAQFFRLKGATALTTLNRAIEADGQPITLNSNLFPADTLLGDITMQIQRLNVNHAGNGNDPTIYGTLCTGYSLQPNNGVISSKQSKCHHMLLTASVEMKVAGGSEIVSQSAGFGQTK